MKSVLELTILIILALDYLSGLSQAFMLSQLTCLYIESIKYFVQFFYLLLHSYKFTSAWAFAFVPKWINLFG